MKKSSRTSNSLKNSFVSIFYSCFNIVITFFTQTVFIKTLGTEYNGIKSLFLNILSMLSIVELGFGTSIIHNLYKPVSDNNKKDIKQIIKFYKKVYTIIAAIVLILGTLVMLLIPYLVKEVTIKENIYIIYILYLINSVSSYLLSYKRSILYADQKNYIISIIEMLVNLIKNIVQIIFLIKYKNIILFLIIQIVATIFINVFITLVVNHNYPYLKNINDAKDINDKTKKGIIKKVKGLMYHKIGGFCVTGTDNILISVTNGLGISTLGLYSNYNMIISNVATIFTTAINSVTSSIGNLLVETEQNQEKKVNTYKGIVLINSWLFGFGSICIYILTEPFIKIWLGEEYLLSNFILLVLVINFYINGIKQSSNIFKEAAGVFYEDRYVPLLESVTNIICSIFFSKIFGLAGIFIGTICCSLVLLCYSYPKYVYKGILNDKIINYYKIHLKYGLILIVIFWIVCNLSTLLVFKSLIIELLLKGVFCIITINLLYLIFVIRSDEFRYIIKKLLKKTNKIVYTRD